MKLEQVLKIVILAILAWAALSVCSGIVLWIFGVVKNLLVNALTVGFVACLLLLCGRYMQKRKNG